MNHIETMKLALEALEGVRIEYDFHGNPLYDEDKKIDPAITSLRQAIEQAEKQEPVAWLDGILICPEIGYESTITTEHPKDLGWTPLYTAPPEAEKQFPENDTRYSDIQLAEMILSDCGVSSENTLLLNRVAARIEKHVDRALEQDADEWFEKALWGEPDVYGDGNVYRGQRSKDSETKTLHYTEPLRSSWFKLTDEEIAVISVECGLVTPSDLYFARAIEAKLKEKNHVD